LVEKDSLPIDIYQPSSLVSVGGNTAVSSALSNELPSPRDYKSHWGEQEKELIQNVLNDTKFNKSKTARILKMDRKTLYSKMEKYGLD
jgi:two-component system response regulator HydG